MLEDEAEQSMDLKGKKEPKYMFTEVDFPVHHLIYEIAGPAICNFKHAIHICSTQLLKSQHDPFPTS